MTAPTQLYPFATQDGKAIPLDIIGPAALVVLANAESITLPAGYEVAAFHAVNNDAVVSFTEAPPGGGLVNGALYQNMLYVPRNGIVIAKLASLTLYVAAATDALLYVQLLEKWSGLALPTQFVRK